MDVRAGKHPVCYEMGLERILSVNLRLLEEDASQADEIFHELDKVAAGAPKPMCVVLLPQIIVVLSCASTLARRQMQRE